jgi:mono/diheme cytochrome c family protein
MKYKYLLLLILTITALSQCARQKKIVYNIPADYPEDKKKELMVTLDKGKKLYKANCSKCHGIFTKGEDGIPNFTDQQMDNYSAGFMRRDRKNHALVLQMSPEQLNQVLTFLRYHKTSGAIPTKPKRDRKIVPNMPGR